MPKDIQVAFSPEELVELLNHVGFTAYHSLEDDDNEAWRVIRISLNIIDKIEAAFPDFVESEAFMAAREIGVLRKRLKRHDSD